jgi:hypothetical protein
MIKYIKNGELIGARQIAAFVRAVSLGYMPTDKKIMDEDAFNGAITYLMVMNDMWLESK